MRERWRAIPDDDAIEVSNLGKVRHYVSRNLKDIWWRKGYAYVGIGCKKFAVHRLVLSAFMGPPPHPKMHCAHLDGNPRNNRLDNLAWVTCAENQSHRLQHGTHQNGEQNHRAKLSAAQVRFIRKSRLPGIYLARIFRVTPGAISYARSGVNWKHLEVCMLRGRKPGRPKGSKNKSSVNNRASNRAIAAPAPKVAATRRGRRSAIGTQASLGSAFSTILTTLETIPANQRPKVMQAINVFIGG